MPFYVCTEQPGVGTMGQHYVNFDLSATRPLDPLKPEALVYEPQAQRQLKLVALEWVQPGPARRTRTRRSSAIDDAARPAPEPVRDRARRFYERHYWLYKINPHGAFEDWNPNVSCRGTGDNGG